MCSNYLSIYRYIGLNIKDGAESTVTFVLPFPAAMRYCFLAFIFCITFVMVSAGMDDRSCSELYQFFVDKHIIPNNHQTLDAFCKNQIDGEYLDTINRIDCEELNLDLNHCEKLHGYLSKIRSLPSSKFKDFWDWRVHNKRISDYWLLPLSQ